jgi:hypothetical protein
MLNRSEAGEDEAGQVDGLPGLLEVVLVLVVVLVFVFVLVPLRSKNAEGW